MSSSFRSRSPVKHRILNAGRGLVFIASVASATSALAVEVYYQPVATLTVENDSNLDLDPGVHQQVQGYLADLATIVGIDTPDWTTVLRPRLIYRDYPEASYNDRLEAYLDFNSNYKTQRSTTTVSGSFQHLDEFNADFVPATFNDINPQQPVPTTGRVTTGATQDVAFLSPKYVYNFTPTIGGGVSGNYQYVKYSPSDNRSHLNFDYVSGRAFLNYSVTQRSTLTFGGFGSQFETKDIHSVATGSGGLVDLNTSWTPLFSTTEELLYQHTSLDSVIPRPIVGSVNKLGGSVDAAYKTETERFRLIARRSIAPSGGGSVYTTDRLQFQYDRSLTARFSVTGAISAIKTHGLTTGLEGEDRKYAQGLVEAHYFLTARWFVQGGYQYAWQKYVVDPDSASNNRVYIQFGYQGLGQQR
jgi:hypothetical protein